MYNKQQDGFVAISTVLVVASVLLIISVTTSLTSIDDMQNSLTAKKTDESLSLVEGCAEDALLSLSQDNTIPASITIPEGTCDITLNSQVGDLWDFTVSGTFETHAKSINITAQRDTQVVIQEWIEL